MNGLGCHRCLAELPAHEDGALVFCAQCGAPQIWLSEELRERSESLAAEAAAAAQPSAPGLIRLEPRMLIWRDGMRFVAVASGVAAVMALFGVMSLGVVPLGCLWALISPILVLAMFHTRTPEIPITPGFGARLGFATGVGVGATMTLIYSLEALLFRFFHVLGPFDDAMTTAIKNAQAQMSSQNTADSAQVAQWMALPEFRAASIVLMVGMLFAGLLVLTTAGGAFAGYARRTRT